MIQSEFTGGISESKVMLQNRVRKLWAMPRSVSLPVFAHQVQLKHSHAHLFSFVSGRLHSTMAGFHS